MSPPISYADESMKPLATFLYILLLALSTALSAADSDTSPKPITVTIDYGGERPARTVTTTYLPGVTALQLLQQVAQVKTYRLGEYLFIRSIDGVAGKRGEMGWFYSVDGVSSKSVAGRRILTDAERMTWRYKVAACY